MKLFPTLQLCVLSFIPFSSRFQKKDICYYLFQVGMRNNLQITWCSLTICNRRERGQQIFQGLKGIFSYVYLPCNQKLSEKFSGSGSNMSSLKPRRTLVAQPFSGHRDSSQDLKNLWWQFHEFSTAQGAYTKLVLKQWEAYMSLL